MTTTASRVQPDSFLTLHYRLGGASGDIINTFDGKPATLTLGTGELAPALELYLVGLEEGTRQTFMVPTGAAFGERNPAMQQWLAAKVLRDMGDPQETYQVGDVVEFPTPDNKGKFAGTVLQLGEGVDGKGPEAVLFDFNHPLAGQAVTFEVQVIGVL
jgi:FKBP-type peptidyl-prolyl cis-trans isomerase SlpA